MNQEKRVKLVWHYEEVATALDQEHFDLVVCWTGERPLEVYVKNEQDSVLIEERLKWSRRGSLKFWQLFSVSEHEDPITASEQLQTLFQATEPVQSEMFQIAWEDHLNEISRYGISA